MTFKPCTCSSFRITVLTLAWLWPWKRSYYSKSNLNLWLIFSWQHYNFNCFADHKQFLQHSKKPPWKLICFLIIYLKNRMKHWISGLQPSLTTLLYVNASPVSSQTLESLPKSLWQYNFRQHHKWNVRY